MFMRQLWHDVSLERYTIKPIFEALLVKDIIKLKHCKVFSDVAVHLEDRALDLNKVIRIL